MGTLTKREYARNWIGLLVLGALNNFFYVLVNSAGQRLCAQFHAENWIGAVLWCNISFGLVARLINMFFLEGTSFGWRIFSAGIGTLIGLVGIIISILAGPSFFWLCLVSIIFIGTACSFGESVALCYLKKFPSELVGAWSSGTGFAGVGGTVIYALLILPGIDLSNQVIFAIVAPFVAVYLLMFFLVIRPPAAATSTTPSETAPLITATTPEKSDPTQAHVNITQEQVVATSPPSSTSSEPALQPQPLPGGSKKFARCFKHVWFLALNLTLVYFFEYVACTGGSDRAQGGDWRHHSNWFVRNSYVVLNVCYQLGVLVSRSSLGLIKIRRIEILTIIQGINMFFWIFQATYHWVQGYPVLWSLFAHMVFVGLLGGGAYVNIFYLVLNKPEIAAADRELSVNAVSLSNTIGITASSIAIIILDHFLWPNTTPLSSSSS